jgi:hypothetical protein
MSPKELARIVENIGSPAREAAERVGQLGRDLAEWLGVDTNDPPGSETKPASSPPSDPREIACCDRDLTTYFKMEQGRARAAERLRDNGYLTNCERRGKKWWVVLKDPSLDEEFRKYIQDRKFKDGRGKTKRSLKERRRTAQTVKERRNNHPRHRSTS